MKMLHRNIPIFIPHLGCPNACVFCNQHSISGCGSFREENVKEQIEKALSTIPRDAVTEIAFFGGSFTGIDRSLMLRLLDTAQDYVNKGCVQSIRLSTRPDYINDEILSILSRYSVKEIELGLQSMSERVLEASLRGHTAEQAKKACLAIKQAGFSFVGQMMIGLPGSTLDEEIETAREICNLGASGARIYPTVVFYDTPLAEMTKQGKYCPLTVKEAAERSAKALRIFLEHDVPCIRIGLCATEDLVSDEKVLAGPNHPALGELVWNAYYYEKIKELLVQNELLGKEALLVIHEKERSKVVGQHRSNLIRLKEETGTELRILTKKQFEGMQVSPLEKL